ncbi:BZ3500_MvSof-1268-A1-R1_Chr8-1g10003 [Microbotryum saponariae]|uniref:BZ3500_MvSof-1268-A1-R1_Chr8-1g10003 protein n=1 Tax=Microbotryum saponariae TaxID=289078 RepID=A0A2X0LQR1_9BASI|nr:BZ3500_MvSof-1268-A1-R1_Chr8-1g10003 [Microbotryum saponariae]SDA08289.1 BZ3501_MvSof-1269-A2-R1_Chr8-1g09726 [Microbotryum saponariae]
MIRPEELASDKYVQFQDLDTLIGSAAIDVEPSSPESAITHDPSRPQLQAQAQAPSRSPFPSLGPFGTLQPTPLYSSHGDAMVQAEPVRIHAQRPSGSAEMITSSSPGCKSGSPSSYSPPSSPSDRRSGSALRHAVESRAFNDLLGTSSIGQTINSPLVGVLPHTPLTRIETAQSYEGGATLSRPATAPAGGQDDTTHGVSAFASSSCSEVPPQQAAGGSSPRYLHDFPLPGGNSLKSRKYRNPATPSGSSSPSGSRESRGRSHSSEQASARYVPLLRPPPLRPHASASPTPSMQSLQNHMYTYGLLNGTLSDLHLVAFGHHYRLHRIVLAGQSGFFTSLLSGGFSEERQGVNRGSDSEVIAVEMDRPLSRVAFEFVLARLYGGGPELVPPPWAKTSAKKPLSETWERLVLTATGRMVIDPQTSLDRDYLLDLSGGAAETDSEWSTIMAPTCQPATPTFLLSLLATATYLEIPAIQSLALHWIQKTITPWTVAQYLGFALGRGLGSGSLSPELDAPCRGLESVGAPYKLDDPSLSPMTETEYSSTRSSRASSISSDDLQDEETACSGDAVSMFVGPEGERIGEACACWLAKWGAETLTTEEWLAARVVEMDSKAGAIMDWEDVLSLRCKIIEPFFYDEKRPACFETYPDLAPPSLAIWSSIGGIDARWVRGVISSDAFFIANTISSATTKLTGDFAPEGLESDGEFQRYLFAKRVIEMRRGEKLDALNRSNRSRLGASGHGRNSKRNGLADGISERLGLLDLQQSVVDHSSLNEDQTYAMATTGDGPTTDAKCPGEGPSTGVSSPSQAVASSARIDLSSVDELEYALLFQDGIHYYHMTYRQLNLISDDYSMTSHVLFAPIEVVQRAHWQIEQFKSRLPLVHTPRSGQALEMASPLSSSRVGGGVPVGRMPLPGELVTLDGLVDIGFATPVNPHLDVNMPALGLQPFYRIPIDDTSRINDRAPHPDSTPSALGLGAPPPIPPRKPSSPLSYGPDGFFGLAREQCLGTRGGPHRGVLPGSSLDLSSEWVEYAPLRLSAEFWGVTALRDNARLYSNTFFYAGSFYNLYLQRLQRKGGNQLGIYLHRQNSIEHFPTPSTPPTRLADGPPYSEASASRSASYSTAILAPYTDQRKQVRAFFSIWVPTQLGSSMTKFSSGPDSFALSQSWGWKSTSLSSEYLGATPIEASQTEVARAGPYSSLRVTIIMGLV